MDCYVIDMAQVDEQGEAPVVNWDFEEIERDKDFAAMLAGTAKAWKGLIRSKKKRKKLKKKRKKG